MGVTATLTLLADAIDQALDPRRQTEPGLERAPAEGTKGAKR